MIKIGNNISEFSVYSCQPKTVDELRNTAKLSAMQCDKYGESICKIVAKYADISDYKSE